MNKLRQLPWLRISAEGVAIVVSILLAFAIQAWWEGRKERDEQDTILAAISVEIAANLAAIHCELQYRAAAKENIQLILELSSTEHVSQYDEIDQLLANLIWWGDIDFASGALDSLIQGGRLPIIQSASLRQRLAELPDRYASVDRLERQTYESMHNRVAPYLLENAFFPQIATGWVKGRPGCAGTSQSPSEYSSTLTTDHTELLDDPEFLGILVLRQADHDDAISGYTGLRSVLNDLIESIDSEIGQ
jgi:hypothetical protein